VSELLPFDINEYRKDPSRLRFVDYREPVESMEALSAIVVRWNGSKHPSMYADFGYLRLAPLEPETVTVRLFTSIDGGSFPGAIVTRAGEKVCPLPRTNRWASDPVEITLYPRSGK
jgi:hypothetical protein